jgi:uncharacterized membrane protein
VGSFLEEGQLRKIFMSGLIICFLIGILVFFFKFLLVDVLSSVFRPVVLHFFNEELLVIPLTIVFTLCIVLIVGGASVKIDFQKLLNKYVVRRVPSIIEKGHGALVEFGPGAYYLAIMMKEISFKRTNGEIEKYYVLFCPSTPIPWSGLPVIYARKEKVIPLKLSYSELYSIFGSFGASAPESLCELKAQ